MRVYTDRYPAFGELAVRTREDNTTEIVGLVFPPKHVEINIAARCTGYVYSAANDPEPVPAE